MCSIAEVFLWPVGCTDSALADSASPNTAVASAHRTSFGVREFPFRNIDLIAFGRVFRSAVVQLSAHGIRRARNIRETNDLVVNGNAGESRRTCSKFGICVRSLDSRSVLLSFSGVLFTAFPNQEPSNLLCSLAGG